MKKKTLIKIAFGTVLILALLYIARLDVVASAILSMNPFSFWLAVAILVPYGLIGSIKWLLIVRAVGVPITLKESCGTYLIGSFFSLVTPSKIGTLAKAYYIKNYHGSSSGSALSLAFIDKVFDMVVVLIIAFFGLTVFSGISGQIPYLSVFAALIMAAIMAAVFFKRSIFLAITKPVLSRLGWLAKAFRIRDMNSSRLAEELYAPFGLLKKKPGHLAVIAVLSVLYWVLYGLQLFAISSAFGVNIDPMTAMLIACSGTAIGLLPITINGVGTRDAIIVYLLSLYGVATGTGIIVSILLFIMTLIISLAGGLVFLSYKKSPDIKTS